MRPFFRSSLVAILIFLCLDSVGAAPAKRPIKPAAQKPPYTLADAQKYVKEALPLVEQVTGKKFRTLPRCKLVGARDLAPILEVEMAPQVRAMMPQLSRNEADYMAYSASRTYSRYALGKYATRAQVLLMIPGNLIPVMKRAKVDPKYYNDIIRLIVAHELTHALQDQQLGLTRLIAHPVSQERQLALASTIEGHAMYVEDQIAGILKLDKAYAELARSISTGAPVSNDPIHQIDSAMSAQLLRDVYIGGRDFIEWQYKQGGEDRIWQILRNPPANTRMIFHPETYKPTDVSPVDYSAVLKGLEQKFGKRKWTVINCEAGELPLRAVYNDMDPTIRDKILAGMEHAQILYATDGLNIANVSLFVTSDPGLVTTLMDETQRVGKLNIEKMSKSKQFKIVKPTFSEFKATGLEPGRKITFEMHAEGQKCQATFVRLPQGKVMLEIYAYGITPSDPQISSICAEVIKRLPKAVIGP